MPSTVKIEKMTSEFEASHPKSLTNEALVRLYSDDVWKFVSSQLARREDVEDVVMEVFAIAFRKIHKLRETDSPKLWLLKIARRRVLDAIRRQYRRKETRLEEVDLDLTAVNEAPDSKFKEIFDDLPELYRQVLLLKYVNGLETEQVASVIKKSAAATNSLLQRARQQLKERGAIYA